MPEHGADRMGRDGALYEMAQWYPRVAVYDDVRGWNIEPYLGQGEFYLDFGDYTLSVTVPAGYIVAATGALQNPREVLTPAQVARHAIAAKSDTVMRLITAAELKSGARPAEDHGHADLEVRREERARRRLGRVARLPVGCVELEGHHGLRLLSSGAPPSTGTTPPTSRACRSWSTPSGGSCTPGRTSRRSRDRSAAWSTR